MLYTGTLTKMLTEATQPITYYLDFDTDFLQMNSLIGQTIALQHKGFQCLECGKSKKIFRQGCCYDCFISSAHVGDWVIRPELSKAHLEEEDRDLAYEQKMQLQPHIVYLALSGNLKVGVTRKSQIPTRWIDQGATMAVPIIEVPNRYLAGITEVALKKYYSDKTNWKTMLQSQIPKVDLMLEREKASQHLPNEVISYYGSATEIYSFVYPIQQFKEVKHRLNLDNTPYYQGELVGIKGQYLLFSDGTAFNVRTYEGYVVSIEL